jgi:threonine/homoserine/homoserine lactone efflux protein
MLFLSFLEVILLGFLCGLIPGPVVTALFTETIRKGERSARRIVFRAAAAETIMSVACVGAFSFLHPLNKAFAALGIFGAMILLHMASELWRVEEITEEEPLFSSRRIFTLALLNGMAWVFWITVCAPQAIALGLDLRGGQWIYVALFQLGWAASTFSLCRIFALFRPCFQSHTQMHLLYRTVAVVFVIFAGKLALSSGGALLH